MPATIVDVFRQNPPIRVTVRLLQSPPMNPCDVSTFVEVGACGYSPWSGFPRNVVSDPVNRCYGIEILATFTLTADVLRWPYWGLWITTDVNGPVEFVKSIQMDQGVGFLLPGDNQIAVQLTLQETTY